MKAQKIIMLIAFVFMGVQTSAQEPILSKESFKVWGNCEMCKTTIEKASLAVDGVKSARWNVATKKIKVNFNPKRTSIGEIKKAIANSGYDTVEFKAREEDYNNLHSCCKYDRK